MAYTEYHIDRRYKLFGKFYHAPVDGQNSNPFLAAHRTFMAAAADAPTTHHLSKFNKLDALGIFAADSNDDKYIPLNAHLVIPDDESTEPYPLAVFIHGQALSYFENDQPITEVKSYRGYRYLQRYLADRGVASVSVNINVVSFLAAGDPSFEKHERFQIAQLVLAMLFQVAGTATTNNQPVFLKKSDDTLAALQDALALEGTFSSRSSETRLRNLQAGIAGKLSFTNLGFMGHSRGGGTVHVIEPFFSARVGTAPSNYATPGPGSPGRRIDITHGFYNGLTINTNNSNSTHPHLYHYMMDLMDLMGAPTMQMVKIVVGLQPDSNIILLNSPTTFYLVLASSHDADVQEGSFNSFDNANCPKAMIFSHGASHGRFNTVWRRLRYIRRAINRQLLCQSPIRMLSNRGHEELAKATVGNAFLATQLGEAHRFLFFTGEQRAPALHQDVERAWKFSYPFTASPAMKVLDATAIRSSNLTTSSSITPLAISHLDSEQVNGHDNYANATPVKAFTRPGTDNMVIRIPIVSGDHLVTCSHFSFRYTKKYDAHRSNARRQADLRNYTLRLKSGPNLIGAEIAGADVASLHHKAYPTKDLDGNTCEEDTVIVMQTAEVPLAQFLPEGQPVTDLNQVTSIEIQLEGVANASGDETWYFVDFVLSKRVIAAAPQGFAIP
ncbi:MAG TPA: hypothetical protein ENJ82_08380 [Bacteroidetes bacterium]|nr:hypothetical protein [Bacteroidota bacterium]